MITIPAEAADRSEHRSVNVSSGRDTRIAYYGTPKADCSAGTAPEITIVEAPSYGKIVRKPDRMRASPASIPLSASSCFDKFVDVIALFYRSPREFHGSDRARIEVKFPATEASSATTLSDEIYISVR